MGNYAKSVLENNYAIAEAKILKAWNVFLTSSNTHAPHAGIGTLDWSQMPRCHAMIIELPLKYVLGATVRLQGCASAFQQTFSTYRVDTDGKKCRSLKGDNLDNHRYLCGCFSRVQAKFIFYITYILMGWLWYKIKSIARKLLCNVFLLIKQDNKQK